MNCQFSNHQPICTCKVGFVPKYPESLGCVEPADDPCIPNPCGEKANCLVVLNQRKCVCPPGFIGDPNVQCQLNQDTKFDGCKPSPCGPNTYCNVNENQQALCSCWEGYFGDPLRGCKPECVSDEDCSKLKSCKNLKCQDPCPGFCGIGAICTVSNHKPICTCQEFFKGDPYRQCVRDDAPKPPTRPQPECQSNQKCKDWEICDQQRCVNPCPERCAVDADCQVTNHQVQCTCKPGFKGDPYFRCFGMVKV